ncbi:MAG: Asp-tRNA(Asn)/Glu-tRNA(Gln) amidotransferase subunit GatA [bacterium]|nr:Asp-tRNA(Asn)/Glu-tRNA(Gln) amidotransferase subunit GatA [bacterium]
MNKSWTDIASLVEGYKTGKLSPTTVVEYYLERIHKLNPELNAYLTVTEDLAKQQAKELEKKLAEIDSFPLFGVPVAFKDLYQTQGIKTTAGSKVLENYIGQYNATAVQRYIDAGAIVLGKLNCDAWAHGSSGENSDFGPTKNPWNTQYVPGGSSSGSAAAVAADLCLVAAGTDTGGSIRCPASFCSVVGLKPTYGRVSRYGIIAMASSLDSIGHITGSVADSARVLAVTAGVDPKDATTSTQPVPDYPASLATSLKGVRIGIPKEYLRLGSTMTEGMDKEVEQLTDAAIDQLQKLGAIVSQVSLPHTPQSLACYYIIQPAEVSSNLARYDGIRYGHDRSAFGPEAKRRIMLGTYTLSAGYYDAYYKTAQKVRTLVVEDFDKAFERVDLIVAPVMPHLPFKIGEKVADPMSLYLEDILTVPVNLAGLPAISLPCGFSQTKLPVGFQLIGPKFSEQKLFAAAQAYELATPFHEQHPSL